MAARTGLSGPPLAGAAGLQPTFHNTIASATDLISGGKACTAATLIGSASKAVEIESNILQPPTAGEVESSLVSMAGKDSISGRVVVAILLGKVGGGGGVRAGADCGALDDTMKIAVDCGFATGVRLAPMKVSKTSNKAWIATTQMSTVARCAEF